MLRGQGAEFGASDLQVSSDDFAWLVQRFERPWVTFSWQAQYCRHVKWKNDQLRTQLSIFEISLGEFLRFWQFRNRQMKMFRKMSSFWSCQLPFFGESLAKVIGFATSLGLCPRLLIATSLQLRHWSRRNSSYVGNQWLCCMKKNCTGN